MFPLSCPLGFALLILLKLQLLECCDYCASHLSRPKSSDNRAPEGRGKIACSLQSKKTKQRTQPSEKKSHIFRRIFWFWLGELPEALLWWSWWLKDSVHSLGFLCSFSGVVHYWAAKFSVWALKTVTALNPESKVEKPEMYFFKTFLSVTPLQKISGKPKAWITSC